MSAAVTIRAMQTADVPAVKKLMGLFQDYLKKLRPRRLSWVEMEKNYWPWLMESVHNKNGFMFLAERHQKITGFITGWVEQTENHAYPQASWPYGLVQDFFVDAPERGQGTGKQLIEAATNFFREKKVARVSFWAIPTNPTITYYSEYGFQEALARMDMMLDGTA